MKTKRPQVKVDWKELYSLLIAHYRQLNKLTIGPLDRLQTREYKGLIDTITNAGSKLDLMDRAQLSAFLLYEWPNLLSQGLSLVQEIPEIPRRVLEIGSGTAPFALAALMSGATEAYALHTNPLALKSGAHLCGRLGHPLSVRECDPREIKDFREEGLWDLIIVSYTLTELYYDISKQKDFVLSLMKRLSPGGHILLVDSSSAEVNRHYLTLRDLLVKSDVRVQAPCIWQGACPALSHGSSPCFTQRPFDKPFIINDIQKSLQTKANSLKMTYFLLCPPGEKTTHPDQARIYRVVSPPIETFKGTRHFLCGVDGKKTLGSQIKVHPKQSRAYEFLKKGDVVELKDPIELEDDLMVTEETTLTLRTPFDKPLK